MKAQSKDYIALQTLYRAKAQADLASVTLSVRTQESKLGRMIPIDDKEIEAFCKGAAFVKLVRGRQVISALGKGDFGDRSGWAARELADEDSLLPILLALMGLDRAYNGVAPPATSARDLLTKAETATFTAQMTSFISTVLESLKASHTDLNVDSVQERIGKVVEEIQRSGPVELHNISSMTGGIVAQEIIKVVTKQYVPVDNTCVIDGIQSKTAVYRL